MNNTYDNEMKIDLNEADYKFVIEEIKIENTGSVVGSAPVKLNINNWYYPMTTTVGEDKSTFELESSKFNGTLNVKFTRARTVVNTNVENVYEDITSKGVIDLTDGKEYVIDFSKTDELTEGLKSFADLITTMLSQFVSLTLNLVPTGISIACRMFNSLLIYKILQSVL